MCAYAGGLGAGQGWYFLQAVVSPAEMGAVLAAETQLTIFPNAPTSSERTQIDPETWLAAFSGAWSRPAPIGELDSRIWASFTTDPHAAKWIPCRDPSKHFVELDRPAVGVRALTLSIVKAKPSFAYSLSDTSCEFGIELAYPRVASFEVDRYATLHSGDSFPDAALFQFLSKQIRSLTRPVTIESTHGRYRSKLRASGDGVEWLNRHPFMIEHGFKARTGKLRER